MFNNSIHVLLTLTFSLQSMSVVDRLKHSASQLKEEAEKFWSLLSKMGGKVRYK